MLAQSARCASSSWRGANVIGANWVSQLTVMNRPPTIWCPALGGGGRTYSTSIVGVFHFLSGPQKTNFAVMGPHKNNPFKSPVPAGSGSVCCPTASNWIATHFGRPNPMVQSPKEGGFHLIVVSTQERNTILFPMHTQNAGRYLCTQSTGRYLSARLRRERTLRRSV